MRRSTGFSANLSRFKASFAGAFVLGITLACGDYGTPTMLAPSNGLQDGVSSVEIVVPDSLKEALSAQFAGSLLKAPTAISANVLTPSSAPSLSLSAACGSGGEFAGYSKSKVPFAPESAPSIAPAPLFDDGFLQHVPIGFSFSFYGNAHEKVSIYSNGFIMFGPAVTSVSGFFMGDLIPFAGNPNNTIALGWSDWSPQKVAGGIKYGTRGEAPNRRFIVQFTNVPEFGGTGRLTSQLVLSEGSNDITIYTTNVNLTKSSNRLTQGIENAAGTEAVFDSVQNVTTGNWMPRVKGFFKLSKDAVRFSLNATGTIDNEDPSITPPANVRVGNDLGKASAVVTLGSPVATDNCSEVTVSGVRSDGLALNAPYPVGVTTVTWTATDAAGNSASAAQSVRVMSLIERLTNVRRDLDEIVASGGSPASKLRDAGAKLDVAIQELAKVGPDEQASVGNIEGAVGDLEAAVNEGFDAGEGARLMSELASLAWELAAEAILRARNSGSDAVELAEAERFLEDGDRLRAASRFKDAVSKYKDALAKAASSPRSSSAQFE